MEKYKLSGDWRKITQIKINNTYITKNWSYNNDLLWKKEFFIPFGMLQTLEKLFSHSKCYQSYKVLRDNVRRELNITSKKYDKNKMKFMITHKENKEIQLLYYIYCSICHKDKLPVLLDKCKGKVPDKAKINDLIEAWEVYGLSTNTLHLAGCILHDQSYVHVVCNGCRFILRPTEHVAIHVKLSSSKGVEQQQMWPMTV